MNTNFTRNDGRALKGTTKGDSAPHTDAHDHEETCQESSKVNNPTSTRFHEVVMVSGLATYPVRQWCDNVGSDDKKRQVVLPQR